MYIYNFIEKLFIAGVRPFCRLFSINFLKIMIPKTKKSYWNVYWLVSIYTKHHRFDNSSSSLKSYQCRFWTAFIFFKFYSVEYHFVLNDENWSEHRSPVYLAQVNRFEYFKRIIKYSNVCDERFTTTTCLPYSDFHTIILIGR